MEIKKTEYYLSVKKNGKYIVRRRPFDDYALAMKGCTEFFNIIKSPARIEFVSEVVDGRFARSYAQLNDERGPGDTVLEQKEYLEYEGKILFLIESGFGKEKTDEILRKISLNEM